MRYKLIKVTHNNPADSTVKEVQSELPLGEDLWVEVMNNEHGCLLTWDDYNCDDQVAEANGMMIEDGAEAAYMIVTV
jgi:hypothetical protein